MASCASCYLLFTSGIVLYTIPCYCSHCSHWLTGRRQLGLSAQSAHANAVCKPRQHDHAEPAMQTAPHHLPEMIERVAVTHVGNIWKHCIANCASLPLWLSSLSCRITVPSRFVAGACPQSRASSQCQEPSWNSRSSTRMYLPTSVQSKSCSLNQHHESIYISCRAACGLRRKASSVNSTRKPSRAFAACA